MLIKITENNGLETYVVELRETVAKDMLSFFKTLGLKTEALPSYEILYTDIGIDYENNLRREHYYKKEFIKFGNKRPNLYVVR